MKIKKLILIIVLILSMLLPVGCWDLADINDHIFILGLGIDPDEEEGLFRFTFHYANPRGEASDQSSGTMTYVNATIRSSSLPLAVRELIRNSDSEANFEHLQTVVLGVKYLNMLSFDDIDMLFRMASVRRKCVVVSTDIDASKLLSMKFSGTSTAVMISRLSNHYSASNADVLSGFSLTSLFSKKTDNSSFYLFSVSAVENSSYSALSATDKEDKKDISMMVTGLSIFQNCKYAGSLGYTELEVIRLLSNRQTEGVIEITSDKSDSSCFQISSSKCTKSCKIVDDEPVFTIDFKLQCFLIDAGSEQNRNAEDLVTENIEQKISHIISLSKKNYGAELLGLESALRQDCKKWFEQNPDYFSTKYKNAKINLNVKCDIASSGIIE